MNACSLPQAAAVLFLSIDASAAFSLTSKMTLSALSTLFSSACSAPDVELPLHSAAEEEDAVDEAAALLGADSYAGSRCCTMSTSHPPLLYGLILGRGAPATCWRTGGPRVCNRHAQLIVWTAWLGGASGQRQLWPESPSTFA